MISIENKVKNLIIIMRPYQWIKNIFIFAPAFFSFEIYKLNNLISLFIGFFGFSLICSGIYIFNDICDRNIDKLHPSKKSRPIAANLIDVKIASIISISLIAMGGGVALSQFQNYHILFNPLLFYVILNIIYSIKLKHIAIIDIVIIAIGFVLRLWVGSLIININLSHWIIIVTFLLSLFLALAKRRDDVILLEKSGKKMRNNIDSYNKIFLDIAMGISASLVMVSYIFYTIDSSVLNRLHTSNLYLTSIFVLLGILRYMQITFVEEKSANPSKILLKDRFLQIIIALWLSSFGLIIYLGDAKYGR